jgi:hypothetical protein
MSLQVILWLATAGGAAVFFLGGLLLGRRRIHTVVQIEKVPVVTAAALPGPIVAPPAPAPIVAPPAPAFVAAPPAPAPTLAAPAAVASERLAAAQAETEHLRAEMTRSRAEGERVRRELDQLRLDMAAQAQGLAVAQGQLSVAKDASRALDADRLRLEGELSRLKATEADLRTAVARARADETDLDAHKAKVRELETAVEQLRLERTHSQEREFALEKQIAAQQAWPELEKTLRHDLVVLRESLRTQEEKAKRLGETNLELRRELDAVSGRATHLESLERENQELRVRSLASEVSSSTNGTAPTPRPASNLAGTHALQILVTQVAGLDSVRAAVIGDDLGLVVACQGTHGDELAAIGALFGRACTEARKVLPLDHIQRILVEDQGNISVTVRPLRSYDGSIGADELTLVTLAHGTEPDPDQVARILAQQGSPPPREAHDAQQLGT